MTTMSNKKKSLNTKALLKAAKLPTVEHSICLRPDLIVGIQQREARIQEIRRARSANVNRLADSPGEEEHQLAAEIQAIREEMQETSLVVTLRSHDRAIWKQRVREHPPREDVREDQNMDCNVDTFWPTVIREAIIEPELDDEDWSMLEAATAGGEWDALIETVFALNRQKVDVPFSRVASQILQTPGDASEPPAPSASPSND